MPLGKAFKKQSLTILPYVHLVTAQVGIQNFFDPKVNDCFYWWPYRIERDGKFTVNGKHVRIWKGAVVSYFMALS
jgi:hypothetical protein